MRNHVRYCRACLVAIVCATAACTTRVEQPASTGSSLAPALVVERFLRAAAANDLETMGRLFGTEQGSIAERDSRADVERRMDILARILRHRDFRIQSEESVAGRSGNAMRLTVQIDTGTRRVPVPFVVVRARDGWLIEQVAVEALTTA